MVSVETAWSSGASGIAAEAETAARPRQIANVDAKSIFMAIFPSLQICRDAGKHSICAALQLRIDARQCGVPLTAAPITSGGDASGASDADASGGASDASDGANDVPSGLLRA